MTKPALRTSLIWHDEVMSDVISDRPRPITIGPSEEATFVTPELGLPAGFAIVRPGMRGHLLTLGSGMRGTICIEGVEHDVAHLVREGFYATAIGGLDWGVIELDASGKLKLFFQFVRRDNVPVRPLFEQEPEQRASLAFSTLLHGALLFATYQLYVHHESEIDPTRDLTARYISTRIESQPAIAKPAPVALVDATVKPAVATPMPAAKWKEPDVRIKPQKIGAQVKPTTEIGGPPPAHSPFDDQTAKIFGEVTKKTGVGQLGQVDGTGGPPDGTPEVGPTTHGDGDGDGKGPHKGPHGVFHGGPETLDTGGLRKGTMCIGSECGHTPTSVTPIDPPQDQTDTLGEKDIDRVIQAAKGRLTACYQNEVNHNPNLAGTVQVRFEIAANGSVTSARVTSSTVRSEAVSDCLTQRIAFLKFPAKGRAVVNYPFVFAVR